MPSPEECAEDRCYLLEQFAELDVTHANAAYGSAVWENLLRDCAAMTRPLSAVTTVTADPGIHPYKTAPNRAFWSRSVSRAFEPAELLPTAPRLISRQDRVASAGSCFASNIVPYLEKAGLHYLREEPPHPAFSQLPLDHFWIREVQRKLRQHLHRAPGASITAP